MSHCAACGEDWAGHTVGSARLELLTSSRPPGGPRLDPVYLHLDPSRPLDPHLDPRFLSDPAIPMRLVDFVIVRVTHAYLVLGDKM
jgi:hypothetical protein